MGIRDDPKDPHRKSMLERIEAIVREFSGDTEEGYLRRMKQVSNYATDRANGDLTWPGKAKAARAKIVGEKCEKCGQARKLGELQTHRASKKWNNDRARRCGYTPENVSLLCQPCHDEVEQAEAKGKKNPASS